MAVLTSFRSPDPEEQRLGHQGLAQGFTELSAERSAQAGKEAEEHTPLTFERRCLRSTDQPVTQASTIKCKRASDVKLASVSSFNNIPGEIWTR